MLDQSPSTKSDYDQIQATKDLFVNCQVSADNYISPKTLCELIKAGKFRCTWFFVGWNLVKFFYSLLRLSNQMNGNIEVASYLKIPPLLFNLKMKFNFHFSITYYCPYFNVIVTCSSFISGNVEELRELIPSVDLSCPVVDSIPALHFTVREKQVSRNSLYKSNEKFS